MSWKSPQLLADGCSLAAPQWETLHRDWEMPPKITAGREWSKNAGKRVENKEQQTPVPGGTGGSGQAGELGGE